MKLKHILIKEMFCKTYVVSETSVQEKFNML